MCYNYTWPTRYQKQEQQITEWQKQTKKQKQVPLSTSELAAKEISLTPACYPPSKNYQFWWRTNNAKLSTTQFFTQLLHTNIQF